MMSDKTRNYFEARIREGPNFNYMKWLISAEAEERPETYEPADFAPPREAVESAGNESIVPHEDTANLELLPKPVISSGASRQNFQQFKCKSAKRRLKRQIEEARDAWNAYQASRARDAVYDYLAVVFSIGERYQARTMSRSAFRQAFRTLGARLDDGADVFSALVRCTCAGALDRKTISKWARALRYALYSDVDKDQLKFFMKDKGGINACAARYAGCVKRHRRPSI